MMKKEHKIYKISKLHIEDFDEYIRVYMGAFVSIYPRTQEGKNDACDFFVQASGYDSVNMYGIKEKEKLTAGMIMLDFSMNLFGKTVSTGGLAALVVDSVHKKKGMAAELVKHYIQHYKKNGASICVLYPFRADFYYNMGFGYGVDTVLYKFHPQSLLPGNMEGCLEIDRSEPEHIAKLKNCYEKYFSKNHGEILRNELFWNKILGNAENRIIAVESKDNSFSGYIIFKSYCQSEWNIIGHEMLVTEWIVNDAQANFCLREFVRRQSDQYVSVTVTNVGEGFRYNLKEPQSLITGDKYGPDELYCTKHMSVMYRVLDVVKIWENISERKFGRGDIAVKFLVEDTFLPESAGEVVVAFKDGKAKVQEIQRESDVIKIQINISDYSSLLMGNCGIYELYNAGRVLLSDESMFEILDEIFVANCRPSTILRF